MLQGNHPRNTTWNAGWAWPVMEKLGFGANTRQCGICETVQDKHTVNIECMHKAGYRLLFGTKTDDLLK